MILSKMRVVSVSRLISTHTVKKRPVESATAELKDSYYKKIGAKADKANDAKPDGWDNAKPFEQLPGPKGLPLIGNLWRFLPGIGEYYNLEFIELHQRFRSRYGDICYFGGIPGIRPIVLVFSPEDIEKSFRNEGPWPVRYIFPSYFYYRSNLRQDLFQGVYGIASAQGEEWFKVRSMVNKIIMQPRTVEMYLSTMDEIADEFIDNIRYLSKTNSKKEMPEDFENEIYKWTMESMGIITYNKRLGALSRNPNEEAKKFISYVHEMFDLMYKLDLLPSLWTIISTRTWRRYVHVLNYITDLNQKYIEESLTNTNPDTNIPEHELSVLERLVKQDKKIAIVMATDMLIAGIDTTGKTLAAVLYHLAKNPNKQQKLRDELKTFMPNKNSPVTKEMLHQSFYLKATIKESMRMSPIAIGVLRTTVKNLLLSGYQIPKGTDILSANFILSLDEKHYIKPNEFIPERWLRTTQDEYSYKNVNQFVTLPFGYGPRSCVGKRLANLELEVALSKIIRNFVISWHHPDVKYESKLIRGIKDPLRYKVEEVDN